MFRRWCATDMVFCARVLLAVICSGCLARVGLCDYLASTCYSIRSAMLVCSHRRCKNVVSAQYAVHGRQFSIALMRVPWRRASQKCYHLLQSSDHWCLFLNVSDRCNPQCLVSAHLPLAEIAHNPHAVNVVSALPSGRADEWLVSFAGVAHAQFQ